MQQRRLARAVLLAASLFVSCTATAFAQAGQRAATGWEVEGYAGLTRGVRSGDGTAALPPAGDPLASTSPIFPARRTPSWFFGDGALMLNQALEALGVEDRVAPLDGAIAALDSAGSTGAAFGMRVRRRIAPRADLELSADVLSGSASLPDDLVDAAAAAEASFEDAMQGLFASGPFTGTEVTSRSTRRGGTAREVAFTGAVSLRLAAGGALVPYVTLGGGLVAGIGDGDELTVEGRYRTSLDIPGAPAIAFDETDRVTLRYGHGRTFVGVAGAGVRRDMSDRWSVRIDGRVFIGGDNTRLRIDAAPSTARGTPAGFVETLTHPNLQFSNDPASGRESSLSASLDGFDAFAGSGLSTRVLITVAIVRRF
jgi:hypothetical protein